MQSGFVYGEDKRMKELFIIFLQFSIVGTMGMIIDFGLTYLCKEYLQWQKYIANTVGFSVAVCSNYILNRFWTFNSRNIEIAHEFFLFMVISLIGLGINNFVLWLIHQQIGISFYYAKIAAIGVTVIWNFFGNYYITFQ